MKQEKTQKSKKWLWLVLGLVALLAAAGIVLALVLGGGQQQDPAGESGGRPQLYWNVDRQQYIEESTGMSLRTKGEDGMYHILFAHDGQQVELTAADKQIVNVIEGMDIMGLAFDADGVIVDAVSVETVATEFAKRFYVSKITDTGITLNSSYAMNGMEKEVTYSDMLGIYDVDPDAEIIGGSAEVGLMDEVTVYANELNEPTHMYIHERAPEAGIYWRVERMYDAEKGVTTREPDENGVYTILFAHEGELVELKCKDHALVNIIDSRAQLLGEFALIFDEEGYIVDQENVALALRGKLLAQDYHVVGIDGDQITIERISSGTDQGKKITFTLTEDCKIFQCCRTKCYEDHCGEPTDHLRLYDRLNVYSDLEGNPIMIHVSIRQIDSPMYYNLERKYTSADGGHTTREKENGYYVFKMLEEDKQVTLRTKDIEIANAIDYLYHGCMGLELDGDIITRVYDAQCVAGYYSPGYRRYVTSLTGGIFTLTSADDATVFANCIMAENCKIYDVTGNPGVKKGTPTTLKLNDRVIAWYDYAQKVGYIYVTDREVTVRDYCQYCKKTVTWEVANKNGLATQDSGKHLHLVLGEDVDVEWGYAVINKGTTICLNLYGSNIRHNGRIFIAGGGKLNIMGKGSVVSSGTHKNQSLLTGAITVSAGELNIYGGTYNSENKAMPTININGKDAVVNLLGGTVNGGIDINNGVLNLGGNAKVLGTKGQLKDNIYVGTTGKLNVKADWTGEASVKVAIVSDTGISKSFATSEGAYTGKLYYESKGNPAVIGKDGGLVVVGEIIPDENDPDYRYCEHCGKRVMWSPAPVTGHGTVNSGEHIHYYLTEDFQKDWGYIVLQGKTLEDKTQVKTTICLDLNGHNIDQMGRIFVAGADLNIMGEGKITTRVHKNATLNTGAITVNSGTLNIYGGTYASDNPDAPAILVGTNAATVNLFGGKIIGGVKVNAGTVTLSKAAAVTGTRGNNLYIGNDAKLVVSGDWTGTAGVAFSYVDKNPISNAGCTGDFTGKLTLEEDNGYQILPQEGKLYIPGYTIKEQTPIAPNFPEGVANGVTSEAWCEACQKNVTWTSASSGLSSRADGGSHHVFVSISNPENAPLTWQLGTVNSGTTVCMYLNDTVTTHNGRLFVLGGSTVNIMGKGSLITNGTNTSAGATTGGITVNEGTVNVLGDVQLKSTNTAVPAVCLQLAKSAVNLTKGSVLGGAAVNAGTLELSGSACADSITVKSVGKLSIAADWTGTADVTFRDLEENPVPNGTATGAYTGKLTTTIADTQYDVVEQEGKLYISGYEGGAVPEQPIQPNFPVGAANNVESEAWCEVCQKNVTWISASSGLGTRADGGHHHVFVSISNPENAPLTWQLGTVNSGTTVCMYLNDTVTTHNGRLFVLGGSTVNIMGKGSLITNGTNTSAGATTGGITVNEGTVNVLGDVQLKSTNTAVPAVCLQLAKSAVNLTKGSVLGGAQVNNGKLTLSGDATADVITVAEAGKLEVAESFTGTAKVTFAKISENPVANGTAAGAYTGKLTTTIDGTDYDIIAQEGKLLISGYTVPGEGGDEPVDPPADPEDLEVKKGQEIAKAANAMTFDTQYKNGLTQDAYCPVCKADKTWTSYASGFSTYFSDGGHHHVWIPTTKALTWGLGTISNGTTVCVHLNGAELTHNSSLTVKGGSVVNFMGTGSLISNGTHATAANVTGNITVADATVNLYGGTYISTASNGAPAIMLENAAAVVNIYSGAAIGGESDGVCTNVKITNGTVNLYGGTIRNGVTAAHGGNVLVGSGTGTTTKAVFNMVDGLITGGKAYTQTYAKGGNVFVYGASGKVDATVFNMTGGTIEKGAAVYGGNVAVQYATAIISGTVADGAGTPSEGYKNPWGGNLYVCNDSVVTFDGAVTGGTGVYCGSVCVAASATMTMNGGSITGGIATRNGGNVRVEGTFIMNDGIISGGSVEGDAHGSHNLYVNNGTAVLNGGRIEATDGTALSGTGIFLNGTANAYLGGNASVLRKDGVAQGCILVAETAKLHVLNNWTGSASVSFGADQVYGATIANAQCGTLTDGTFAAGGSYTGILLNEKGDAAKILGADGVLSLEAAPAGE